MQRIIFFTNFTFFCLFHGFSKTFPGPFSFHMQCLKLRVHPAPGVHNLAAGCTHFGPCAPGESTLFQMYLYTLYRSEPGHDKSFSNVVACRATIEPYLVARPKKWLPRIC